ncbi:MULTISPECIES: type III secretion system stator protein SctL [Pseudomonas]|uniref:HrpE/YscL family type III secretion apparatus protein n=1 Tax=Pseudomonas gessardii TaxID=78544 RepID=A0ABS9F0H3_9PSED|nr:MULTISPECIES: type III secretion system stator protein SctL [Pseudomonas]MBH3425399.1 type III secretion system stator protein SctL [Pseudomonas gessardii]MCF4982346.1 HrpE/YscL family type III secretion apparatus protein [Pseudomonas gessardii]MCF4993024.1 HrpE/YscL family type III secretion apparatus protein [Pseudomonas gessardii]MCF5088146.1 HrpE/YscL family type III secretion apparatus protein [Pseudomonas gessardii]MCF5098685.1 HrpE/YscL family type III secretion apparatus protein [Ps
MLARRKINLLADSQRQPHPLIPRETLTDYAQAHQVLSRARAQANEMLKLAKEQSKAHLQKLTLEFWLRADAQLSRWNNDRQQMYDNLEEHATSITTQAIRLLLDDTPDPKRLAAMIKQLLANLPPAINATLFCNPHEIEDAKHCLASHSTTAWNLQPDETVKPQTLVLKTDEGDYHISWNSMREAISTTRASL